MEYMLTGSASDIQVRGGYGQQALAQVAENQRLEKEVFEPARKIQIILKTGTKVNVNHQLSFTRDINKLSKFLVFNNTTVHTYSYFSMPQSMNYNMQLTTSEALNRIRIQKLYDLSEIRALSFLRDHEVDTTMHESLSIIHAMVGREYRELQESECLFQAADKKIKTFVCRHLSFAYIFGLIEVENINIIEYFSTSRSDATRLNTMHDKLENMVVFVSDALEIICRKSFFKNMTIGNLIDIQKELHFKGLHALDDMFEKILKSTKICSRDQKVGNIGYLLQNKLLSKVSIEEKQQIDEEYNYFLGCGWTLYPIVNSYFDSTEYKCGFCISTFSINSFLEFIHETCQHIYYNKPINHEEKYLFFTPNHVVGFKIKHQEDGVIIKFYDPNECNEKIICITHGDYAKEITISDFFDRRQLEAYHILCKDNYDLHYILCSRVVDLHSQ